jgi:hypothetical protein
MRLLWQTLFVSGVIAGVLAEIGLLRLAWRSGGLWFLACFFIPGGTLVYFLSHREQSWRLMTVCVGASVIAGVAWYVGGLSA